MSMMFYVVIVNDSLLSALLSCVAVVVIPGVVVADVVNAVDGGGR